MCTRCSGGAVLPEGGEAVCVLCALGEVESDQQAIGTCQHKEGSPVSTENPHGRVPGANLIDLDAYRARKQSEDGDPRPPSDGGAGLPVPAKVLDLDPTGRAA